MLNKLDICRWENQVRGGACTKYASYPDDIPLQSGLCWVLAKFRTSSTKTVFRIWGIPSITNYARMLVWLFV